MRFVVIDPEAKVMDRIDVRDIASAYRLAGLKSMETDHGTLMMLPEGRVCYVVYEFGFFVPAAEQHYCLIGDTLIAGNALLYQCDEFGRTIDMKNVAIQPHWFKSADEVEIAIAAGACVRPQIAVNGDVIWSWPQPAPPDLADKVAARTK